MVIIDADTSQARVYIKTQGGGVHTLRFADQSDAYSLWLALGRGTLAAFRGAGDARPVYPWDFVDQL